MKNERRMRFAGGGLVLALLIAALLTACAPGTTPAPGAAGDPTAAATTASGLKVEGAFSRPVPAGGNGGAFLTVKNTGPSADRLISARSPVAPITELHETINDNGVMKMRPVPGGFEVPAKGQLELKPGGKHVMFVGLTTAIVAGTEVELTLVFEKAGEITVKAPVKE